jgi:Zn(2)-Cys(6) binuclear cluster domain-containing protein
MGRQHKKSRFGCKVCKQRKVKCDETKPACTRCVTSDRHCSYLGSPPALPGSTPAKTPISRLSSSQPSSSPASISDPFSSLALSPGGLWDDAATAADYSLIHMELLVGFRERLKVQTPGFYHEAEQLLSLVHSEAFRCGYLMDALLGLAAAHKSTMLEAMDKGSYLTEATRLQTRAIQRFEKEHRDGTTDTADGRAAAFLFSSVLSQHVIFDVFSLPGGLSDILDRFVHCIHLHQGIRHTASLSQGKIDHHSRDRWPVTGECPRGPECDGLLKLVRDQGADETTTNIYLTAVDILQWLFDEMKGPASRRMSGVHEWPVRISLEYVDLLRQRRPEALAIMAYYAVIVHRAHEYWAVAGSGRPLVLSISSYLGEYWADWLRWPLQAVGE